MFFGMPYPNIGGASNQNTVNGAANASSLKFTTQCTMPILMSLRREGARFLRITRHRAPR
jgi:hypothetical protein